MIMSERKVKLQTGDWVEVKSPREISATLDAEGTLDGLPFMPEMAAYCGQQFRVLRRAEKTCTEYPGRRYKMREFRNDDVVLLEVPRCTGADHGGCQRLCVLFWKTAWLKKCESAQAVAPRVAAGEPELRRKLMTLKSPNCYVCQATELRNATQPLPRWKVLVKCFRDVQSGSRSFREMTKLVLYPLWSYAAVWRPRPIRVGNLKRTPVASLDLQAGELVKIKSEDEIVETLDSRALNRGLSCDGGMRQFCGQEHRVIGRLDRMISETTGEMMEVRNTVMLERLKCLCWYNHVGGCPRDDFMYWREIWLNPVGDRAAHDPTPVELPREKNPLGAGDCRSQDTRSKLTV
jgi:hypothetical protein